MTRTAMTILLSLPDFRRRATLTEHIQHTMQFYYPRAVDSSGGFYHFFNDDGQVYDARTRHLVSSTRFIFTFSMAYRHFQNADYLAQVQHGLRFLREVQRNANNGGYDWLISWETGRKTALDSDQHCYGLAFVLLAYAHASMAGVAEARDYIAETFDLMEVRFWQAEHGLYADQADQNWQLSSYRGQNANMHACEALLSAFEATGEVRYLQRAYLLAHNITVRQAQQANGLIWEHYDANWQVDWQYNRHDPANLFRPWGFQPGHFTEWAKLLLLVERQSAHLQEDCAWLLPRAEQLFASAWQYAWDKEHGGLCYGFAPDLSICDGDKYFWVQAESLAAAAMLATRTGKDSYWQHYQQLWEYSWRNMIDHEYGAWYRILSRDNRKLSTQKSPAGKVDYHTMGACYEVLALLTE